jgi:XFP N-terminal domain
MQPTYVTSARTHTREDLELIDGYWRAANYLSVGQIYLMDNPLLREPLRAEHVKPRGHLLERAGVSRGVPRPRRRSDHDAVLRAVHPRDLGRDERSRAAEIDRPPTPRLATAASSSAATSGAAGAAAPARQPP